MHKIAKQSTVLFTIVILVVVSFGTAATAQDMLNEEERSAEKMTVDFILLRPAGFIATTVGSLLFVVSLPFSALGGNYKEAFEKMVKKPAKYTFKRRLGDFTAE